MNTTKIEAVPARVGHCWADGPDGESTCLLPHGHEGPHLFTPDDQILVAFPGKVLAERRTDDQ